MITKKYKDKVKFIKEVSEESFLKTTSIKALEALTYYRNNETETEYILLDKLKTIKTKK